jgi:hypothetical protein
MHSDGAEDNPVCGFCGGIVPPDFWYCTHCGADLTPAEAPSLVSKTLVTDDPSGPELGAFLGKAAQRQPEGFG